jgi:mono/diheme cytochrome c family protein
VFDRFDQIVVGGTQANRGMPSFKGMVSEAELAAIKTYVLTQRAVLTK